MYGIIDNFWALPAIIRGIKKRIWEVPTTEIYLLEIWKENGLLNQDYKLTEKGEKTVACGSLLEYELALVVEQTYEDNPETKAGNYELLREGLGQYATQFLIEKWLKIIHLLEDKGTGNILDYGGGAGFYASAYKEKYPLSKVYVADRPGVTIGKDLEKISVDFKQTPNWYEEYRGEFDAIFLNEVMHLSTDLHDYFLDSCRALSKSDGYLVIGEQLPSSRFNWRMDAFTDNGQCVDPEKMRSLATRRGWNHLLTIYASDSHYYEVFRND